MHHSVWISAYSRKYQVWKLFEVVCLNLRTATTLYCLDENEMLLEIFAYPSYKLAFYWPELDLHNAVLCGIFPNKKCFGLLTWTIVLKTFVKRFFKLKRYQRYTGDYRLITENQSFFAKIQRLSKTGKFMSLFPDDRC